MTNELHRQVGQKTPRGFSGMQVLAMVVGAMCLGIVIAALAIKLLLFPGPFKPVVLSDKEEQRLATKLETFENIGSSSVGKDTGDQSTGGVLQPEKYSEEEGSRSISFTERELNSMVAKNTDLAEKLAIDLADNMVSFKLLVPLDPDFPILGGKTLKLKGGTELAYRDGRPVVKLKGLSVMGVPMPNAWLGGLKNIDLVQEFGTGDGFWQTFADGVESIAVVEGLLQIQLKE